MPLFLADTGGVLTSKSSEVVCLLKQMFFVGYVSVSSGGALFLFFRSLSEISFCPGGGGEFP